MDDEASTNSQGLTVRLWSFNRWLRWFGVTITVDHPTAPEVPTLIRFSWIGWGAKARAANDCRGPASGYERDADGEARYMRCVQAMHDAYDEAVAREYG